MPEASAVESLVRGKGLFSFFKKGHAECCAVRKNAPLRRRLDRLDAWITGQRRDQSVTRGNVPIEQLGCESRLNRCTKKHLLKSGPCVDRVFQYALLNTVR